MPKAYEAMRDKFAKGAAVDSPSYDAAQSKAAAIYNSTHHSAPVTGHEGSGHEGSGHKKKAGKKVEVAALLKGAGLR